jgi:dihydropteroate synthase
MSAGVARLPPPTALMAVAAGLAEASAAVAAGANLIDLGAATPATITAFRSRHPGIPICAAGSPADVVRDAAVARVTGAMLLCGDADAALDSGIPPDQVLVDALPVTVPEVCQKGLAALVDVDRAARLAARHNAADRDLAELDQADCGHTGREPAGFGLRPVAEIVSLAALSSWLGASVVRTSYPAHVRQALDMTASVRGTRPPARAVRGLA